ncbi:MAG: cell division protein FtsL [Gammaproteobacteria bacterium]|nr:cell division protein FtsL [Gammaproteobacteria bacterium]
MKYWITLAVLGGAIFASALQVVLTRYQTRQLFVELQDLKKQKDDLDNEWSQLLLEQGTWGTHARVEEIARGKLDMTIPEPTEIRRTRS